MITQYKTVTALLVSLLTLSSNAEAIELPESITVAGTELPLIASATRRELWVDVYECGIYGVGSEPDIELVDDGPVVVEFRVTTDLLPDDPPAVWRETLKPALSSSAYRALTAGFAELDENEYLEFFYSPAKGTTVFVDGEKLFASNGDELIRAILALLVGPDPASAGLKSELLSAES